MNLYIGSSHGLTFIFQKYTLIKFSFLTSDFRSLVFSLLSHIPGLKARHPASAREQEQEEKSKPMAKMLHSRSLEALHKQWWHPCISNRVYVIGDGDGIFPMGRKEIKPEDKVDKN